MEILRGEIQEQIGGKLTMTENDLVKASAEEKAAQLTDWERQRLDYYQSLRYGFSRCHTDYWMNNLFNRYKMDYVPEKSPSRSQVRRSAGIGFFENALAFFSKDKRKKLSTKKAEMQDKLKAEIDEKNSRKRQQAYDQNQRLNDFLREKQSNFISGNPNNVIEYFTFVIGSDSYKLDGTDYYAMFNLDYIQDDKQLVIDYCLPSMSIISDVKEWKVGKDNELTPRKMSKSNYLEMYERILFDLSIRVVSLAFESDNYNIINSIVFNGSCIYNNWQKKPTVLISFIMPKDRYNYKKIQKMDFISKVEISKLQEVRYIDDIKSLKPSSALFESPPSKLVVPIHSTF